MEASQWMEVGAPATLLPEVAASVGLIDAVVFPEGGKMLNFSGACTPR